MTNSKRFSIVEYPEASDQVKSIYDETMKEMGIPFVLNWFKCQGNNPTKIYDARGPILNRKSARK